jgi:hypothetical protein
VRHAATAGGSCNFPKGAIDTRANGRGQAKMRHVPAGEGRNMAGVDLIYIQLNRHGMLEMLVKSGSTAG